MLAGTTSILVHNSSCGIPLGFADTGAYNNFIGALENGLEGAGYGDTRAAFQGSPVTGVGYKSGLAFGDHSDYDIALGGDRLFTKAKELGIGLRSRGTRTGPLSPSQLDTLGLSRIQSQLQQMAGREVHFMIYDSIDTATARGPSLLTGPCGCE